MAFDISLGRWAARAVIVGVVAVAAGCATEPGGRDGPSDRVITPNPRSDTKRTTFGQLPAAVRDAFRREHARVDVTDVAVEETETGIPLYRIVYRDDGLPAEATYRADGAPVSAGAAAVISDPLAAPATRPVGVAPAPAPVAPAPTGAGSASDVPPVAPAPPAR